MKTFVAKEHEIEKDWILVDARDKVVGRLATQIAMRLRGKHKPTFTPHADTGDFVVVVNADKVRLTGAKLKNKKYYRYTGYIGGLKETTAAEMFEKKPVGINPPMTIELKVVKTEPYLKGATQSASNKPAMLETGITINVPQFIKEGDTVKIDTREDKYIERSKG